MNFLDILFLAIALAMDCFAVSIVSGVLLKQHRWAAILRMSLLFGIFQALMPLIGWLLTSRFAHYINTYDHWIAFGLLVFLGVRMMRTNDDTDTTHTFRPTRLLTQISLAFATSIDALAVGISFACIGYNTLTSLTFPLTIIGIVSFLFGVIGNLLGLRFGSIISRRLRPSLIGGLILIIIGVKILLTHLCQS